MHCSVYPRYSTIQDPYGNNAETFDVTLNIFDEEQSVYHIDMSSLEEMEPSVDTLGPGEWPAWTPGNSGEYTTELIVTLDGDHCPANDTCRKYVNALYAHDVGVVELTNLEGHEWGNNQVNPYPEGTEFTCVATVENFGANAEDSVYVDLDIYDLSKDPDSVIFIDKRLLVNLDWRGNEGENPYVADVTFPVWSTPSEDGFRVEYRIELAGDDYPENDECTREINIGITEEPEKVPFSLDAVTISPDRRSVTISYSVPRLTDLSLRLYDVSGKLVKVLKQGRHPAGTHTLTWNGLDDAGRKVAQGVYLVRMEAGDWSDVKKVVIY
ncbi:T9SS type A sorting domain-containing protein [candidate division WOR-3 bacterium]|uniref:T9SS type A sorting domain-containing protein n=1 Tax=candidate division WOR-3 bacterium TaxID=2052148 RepID=A0A9D5K811_UNCW3|nr:T9SS type A sorting domain-containing protein [candidate division WOR-3 bacterium]MBD3364111.1 T9SS type A sorting domain-containing protein [candidate division WOR-3 bacterium]